MKLLHLPWIPTLANLFPNPLPLLGGALLCGWPEIVGAQSVSFAGAANHPADQRNI